MSAKRVNSPTTAVRTPLFGRFLWKKASIVFQWNATCKINSSSNATPTQVCIVPQSCRPMPRSCDAWARAPAWRMAWREGRMTFITKPLMLTAAMPTSSPASIRIFVLSLFFMLPELNVRTRAYVRVRARHIGALRRVRRTSCPNRE